MGGWTVTRETALTVIALALSVSSALAAERVKYEPNWDSLDKRPTPQWFHDARFGIFIHWGVYSVPAWAPKGQYAEWYWNAMQDKKGATWKHHVATYGENFDYKQFAPMFKAEKFNPDQWADLFVRSGARYVVLTSKHHDGFCLWPSAQSPGWNAVEVGPKRDLLGDLTAAVRKTGLKMGFYFSFYEWYHPLYKSDPNRYAEEHAIPQFKDLLQRYSPSIVWPDGEWEQSDKTWKSEELLAWVFNESACPADVAVNDRWGKGVRGKHGGYYTSEYSGFGGQVGPAHIWEECQGIGRSFGYNRNEAPADYRTTKELVRLLVNCVSNGGNLLLDIGPDADGTIPRIMQDRLLEMGAWLKANGESIYGAGAGPVRGLKWGRTTAKPGKVFLHVFDWPKDDLEVTSLTAPVKCAYMLADPDRPWLMLGRSSAGWPTVTLPVKPPDSSDSVVVLELDEGRGAGKAKGGVKAKRPAKAKEVKPTVQADDGTVALAAANAVVHGTTARYESGSGKDNIGYWTRVEDWLSWPFELKTAGKFTVEITYACAKGSGGSSFTLEVGENPKIAAKVKETGSWTKFTTEKIGAVELAKSGKYELSVRPTSKPGQAVMNLQAVTLKPVKE